MSNPKDPFEERRYGPTYQPKGSGNEVGNVPEGLKEGDDLPATDDGTDEGFQGASLEKLGDYLSARTKDPQYGNYYNIESGHSEAISHRDVSGGTPEVPSGFSSGGGNENSDSQKTFMDEVLEIGTSLDGGVKEHHFVRIGESDYAGQPMANSDYAKVNPDSIISKTSHGPGHTLYSGVNKHPDDGTPASDPIQVRTSAILENNRFHPGPSTPYIKDGGWGKKDTNPHGTLGSQQKIKGRYDPSAKGLDAREMMKMGRALLIAATGHGQVDPDGGFLGDMASLPNLAQLQIPATQVEVTTLDPHGMINAFDGNEEKWDLPPRQDVLSLGSESAYGQYEDTVYGDEQSINRVTYGQLNSHVEPFAGPLPIGMVILAATSLLSMLALTIIIRALILTSTDPFASSPNHPQADDPTTLPKGKSRQPSVANFFLDLLGIPATEAPLVLAMERGMAGFYGFSKPLSEMSAQDIIDDAINIATASGYYASVMRHVVRDLEQTEKAIMNFPTTGVTAAVSGAIGVITEFASSTSFRFLMHMAALGDIIIASESFERSPVGQEIDDIKEGPGTRVAKSRVAKNNPALVWRQSALPSRYILPQSYSNASIQFGLTSDQGARGLMTQGKAIANKLVATAGGDPNSGAQAAADKEKDFGEQGPVQNGRLSQEYVKHIEDMFEMEYVPFYFHDLRTNEILGFHAFIESITDDYAPDYNTVSSYGRVDDIRIWKKTSRSMNLTFFVAATSPSDFDAMWFDVNKLVSMVYPQWSRGQALETSGGDKFIMPFSQIPMSSPLIRLRLGDLIKSNYSRFNLARLFGLGQEDKHFDLSKKTIPDLKKASDLAAETLESETVAATARLMSKTIEGDTTDSDGNVIKAVPPASVDEAKEIGLLAEGELVIVANDAKGYRLFEADEDGKKRARFHQPLLCTVEAITVLGGSPLPPLPGVKSPEGDPYWIVKIVNPKPAEAADPDGKGFYVPWSKLRANKKTLEKLLESEESIVSAQQADKDAKEAYQAGGPNAFFGPENNAIVRSFESAGGRGLAGHITSLSLGYDDAPWETRRLGSKAPMWVKITMGFAPIHDIPPGMDADGFNRAPIYNVGRTMNALAGDDIHGQNFNSEEEGTLQAQDQANRSEITKAAGGKDTSTGGFDIF